MSETVTNERGGKQSHIAGRYDLLPPNALKLVAECLAFGAAKYGDSNWHQITVWEHLNHALNHANEYRRGDKTEMHLVNLATRALMALEIAAMQEGHPVDYRHPDQGVKHGSEAITVRDAFGKPVAWRAPVQCRDASAENVCCS